MHAGWNLAVKRATGDRYIALWGAFSVTAPPTLLLVFMYPPVTGSLPWAALSGLAHVPYCWFLARGYDRGDYSVVYPIARGGGAALGGIGGFLFLDDRLSVLGLTAIAVIVCGLILLPDRRRGSDITAALAVASTIAVYSVSDARGIRMGGSGRAGWRYVSASFLAGSICITLFGLLLGKGPAMRHAVRADWKRFVLVGSMSKTTYAMVQFAMRLAPVGYVSALRESSVVFASLIGWKFLGETGSKRRLWCSGIVAAGLLLLVVAR